MNRRIEDSLISLRAREALPHPDSARRRSLRARLIEAYPETRVDVFHTRLGWIGVAWTVHGIIALELPRRSRTKVLRGLQNQLSDSVLAIAPTMMKQELLEYAQGHRRVFDLPLDWALVKPFQRLVLSAANNIPFGETRTYGWIAKQIGLPRAARAVGRALATNPIPLILPCHRVIGSNGSLTGYGGGLPLKKRLLEMESAQLNA